MTEAQTQIAAGIDIDSLDTDTQLLIDVPLVFDAEMNPIAGFKVVGKSSQQYQDIKRKIHVLNIKTSVMRSRQVDPKTDKGANAIVDDVVEREQKIVGACTVDWYGFLKGGQPLPLTEENLLNVLTKRPLWREKAFSAIEAEQDFING